MSKIKTDDEKKNEFHFHFKDHEILNHFSYDQVEIIEFGQKGSSNGWMRYIINGYFLTVQGDFDDAVYKWNQNLNFDWLSGLNLDYFASKCQASEYGIGYKHWDKETAEVALEIHLVWDNVEEHWEGETDTERYKEDGIYKVRLKKRSEGTSYKEYKADQYKLKELVDKYQEELDESDAKNSICTEFEWLSWLSSYGHDYFSDEWYEYGDIGKTIDFRCELHLHGIKLIAEKLRELKGEK